MGEEENVNERSSMESKTESKLTTPVVSEEAPSWTKWTASSYAVVMLLLGIPLWWKTTTVQRVPLPYYDMLTLHDQFQEQLLIGIPLLFKGFSSQLGKNEVDQYQNVSGFAFKFSYSVMSAVEMDVVYKSQDLYTIDKQLCSLEAKKADSLLKIYYVGRADLLKEYGHKVILGNCRSIYYISNKSQINVQRIDKLLLKLAGMSSDLQVAGDSNDNTARPVKDLLQLPLSDGYDLLLSLLVPEPEALESYWEIERGVKDYLDPMVQKLSPFATFTVRSQVLYYIKLNLMPRYNGMSGIFEIPNGQLPLVINPVESKLSSFVSQHPALNFLTYTAPCDKYPLQILDEDGSGLMSNAFLVPQWGGIFIYNAPCPQRNESAQQQPRSKVKHEVAMEQVMAVVLSQFRSLIGLSSQMKQEDVLDFRGSALRDWEVDMLVRQRLRNLLFTSGNTLQSLGNLLDQITNIVVTDQVGREVERSVQSIKKAFEYATAGNLSLAQQFALDAFKASEIAFHHPTNLAQLYFPDDQKYAIYIPLFLPVGIPVLFSLRLILTSFLRGHKSSLLTSIACQILPCKLVFPKWNRR